NSFLNRIMEISKADQIALDDALVAPANRLKIGKCNLRLSSDVTSKEATLQVVYNILKLTPFYKAFQVSADFLEIYMQEFWASAYIHNRSVRFKMNNKKHILNLDQFRDVLQICPKVGNAKFEEPPLEKEILAFLASLGHTGEIRKITDVNGMYNNKKVDYAYLLWEDFIFQIENKNTKKGNTMYYPRFTKLIVNFVMTKDPSIPRRNKKPPTVPKEKKGEKTRKGKQKAKELETISEAILTEAEQLKIITKRSQKETHSSHANGSGADEGTGISPGVLDAPDYDSDDDISWKSSKDDQDEDKNEDDENVQDDDDDAKSGDHELKSQDDEAQTESEDDDDEDSDNEVEGVDDEGEKSDEDDTYVENQGNEADRDTNANLEGRDDVKADVVLPQDQVTQEIEDTHVTLTPINPDGQQQRSSISSGFVSNMLNPNQDTGVDAIFRHNMLKPPL
ncbi:hypothetical protein Tco_1322831, partial [Tanacetum coccineum]